jgi:hypothetical protein
VRGGATNGVPGSVRVARGLLLNAAGGRAQTVEPLVAIGMPNTGRMFARWVRDPTMPVPSPPSSFSKQAQRDAGSSTALPPFTEVLPAQPTNRLTVRCGSVQDSSNTRGMCWSSSFSPYARGRLMKQFRA